MIDTVLKWLSYTAVGVLMIIGLYALVWLLAYAATQGVRAAQGRPPKGRTAPSGAPWLPTMDATHTILRGASTPAQDYRTNTDRMAAGGW